MMRYTVYDVNQVHKSVMSLSDTDPYFPIPISGDPYEIPSYVTHLHIVRKFEESKGTLLVYLPKNVPQGYFITVSTAGEGVPGETLIYPMGVVLSPSTCPVSTFTWVDGSWVFPACVKSSTGGPTILDMTSLDAEYEAKYTYYVKDNEKWIILYNCGKDDDLDDSSVGIILPDPAGQPVGREIIVTGGDVGNDKQRHVSYEKDIYRFYANGQTFVHAMILQNPSTGEHPYWSIRIL